MKVEEALEKLIKNELIETDKPTHEHGEHHKL
jgi:predicted Fe-Mo cluster-binding NifX family protein